MEMVERLTAVAGSMFSGKSTEVFRLIDRAEHAGRQVQLFKPRLDDRWGKVDKVITHAKDERDALAVKSAEEILENVDPDVRLIAIDEVQFFDEKIVDVVKELLDRDIEVIVAGLPLDFRGEPFGQMPTLLAMADDITRLTAICKFADNGEICGNDATRTQRIIEGMPASYNDPIVLIGAEESYEARCPNHHIVPDRPSNK